MKNFFFSLIICSNFNLAFALESMPRRSAFFDGGSQKYERELNNFGIPTKDLIEHPSKICSYGLDLYSDYLVANNDQKLVLKSKLLNVANYLVSTAILEGDHATWKIKIDYAPFGMKAPWSSGLTNAWCAGTLLFASYLDSPNKNAFLDLAKKAVKYLFVPVEKGGALFAFNKNSQIWIEEYPNKENPSHVLNGFLFILDILDLFKNIQPETAQYFEKGMVTLQEKIHEFDVDYGSIYDLHRKGNKIGMSYHTLHWKQLLWVYKMTSIDIFKNLAKKWFELEYQSSEYSIETSNTVNSTKFGVSNLNNNVFWYGYWSGKLPLTMNVKFTSSQKLNAINIFYVAGNVVLPTDIIYTVNGKANSVAMDSLTIKAAGENVTSTHKTTVYVIQFETPIVADKIELNFPKTGTTRLVSIRELGFWRDLSSNFSKIAI